MHAQIILVIGMNKFKNIKEKIDELSIHYYSIRTEKDKNPPNYKTRFLPTVAAATEVELMLDQTINDEKKYK